MKSGATRNNLWIFGFLIAMRIIFHDIASARLEFTDRRAVQLFSGYFSNPDFPPVYKNSEDFFSLFNLREIMDIKIGNSFTLESHAICELQDYTGDNLSPGFNMGANQMKDAYRYPHLIYSFLEERNPDHLLGQLSIDRLNAKIRMGLVEIVLGRQPLNMQTCFFLTPNDIFQSFNAEAVDRIYRRGVDGVRLKWFPGDLIELNLYYAAGFDRSEMEWRRSAALAHGIVTFHAFEFGLFAGKKSYASIAGASIQGEIAKFGVRGEMNYQHPDQNEEPGVVQISTGTDYRFPSSLHLIFECLYNGAGQSRASDYFDSESVAVGEFELSAYPARFYLMGSASYEPYPLLSTTASLLVNLNDSSELLMANILYSVSDNADLGVGVQTPFGKKSSVELNPWSPQLNIESQYGLYPASVYFELKFFIAD